MVKKSGFWSFLACVAVIVSSWSARANFHVEPYLGIPVTGQIKNTNDATPAASFEADLGGTAFGARLGWGMLGFAAGLEYQMSKYKFKSPKNALGVTNGDENADGTDLGFFVGFSFPILLRIYATYFIDSQLAYTIPGTTNKAEHAGTGYKLGVGYTGIPIPFLSVNLEIQANAYDEDDALSGLAGYSVFKTALASTWLNVSLVF
jgi:hypothetical protein